MTQDNDIAEAFASHFESVYGGSDNQEHVILKSEFEQSFFRYHAEHLDVDISFWLLTWSEMKDVAVNMTR